MPDCNAVISPLRKRAGYSRSGIERICIGYRNPVYPDGMNCVINFHILVVFTDIGEEIHVGSVVET